MRTIQTRRDTRPNVSSDNAPSAGDNNGSPWMAFGALGGGESRYDTGSHADLTGFTLLTGLARRSNISAGAFTYGAFFEYGQADINTRNTFANQADINTNGESDYMGGGLFTRFDHSLGFYADASLRVGSSEVDQNTNDYLGFIGQNIEYDTNATYYGASLGLGYLLDINDVSSVDLYGKYSWTHQDGDTATIAGDRFNFDDIDSHRTRLGARYNHALTPSPWIWVSKVSLAKWA